MKATEPLLEIKNLWAAYDANIVLHNINFLVQKNDFVAIIGPNGGGKTTLLRCIANLHQPVQGQILINQKRLNRKRQVNIGYVPQKSHFNNHYPVDVKNIISMAFISTIQPFFRLSKTQKKQITNIMQEFDIEHLARQAITQLSGGQLQRVLIARALVTQPDLLLLDEPIAHLDPASSEKLYSLLHQINQTTTIIMTTHDVGALSTHLTSIGCLNKKLHYHGAPEINQETLNEVYGCDMEIIAHGVPHRVLGKHNHTS